MPQETNLNVSPYFDDFNAIKNYHKVLFKPGYPVQARELTTTQTIIQNQIESFADHIFKEGSRVVGGDVSYNSTATAVILQNEYLGLDIERYLPFLENITIIGRTSGVRARVYDYIPKEVSVLNKHTIYVEYLSSGELDGVPVDVFLNGEVLELESSVFIEDLGLGGEEEFETTIQSGEGFAITDPENSYAVAGIVYLNAGIYYIRGFFVEVEDDYLILDQYTNQSNYRVGLYISEEIVSSYDDDTLNDNSNGFSNYAAPGADRLKISVGLAKVPLETIEQENFIELMEIINGVQTTKVETTEYSAIAEEFADRTYDESGNYYVRTPSVDSKETLNDLKGNNGIFTENLTTYTGNKPSEDLGTYIISPLKAYVNGYEIETTTPTLLDYEKPRDTKTLENQSINYFTGPTYTLNRVYGSPSVAISTSYTVSLRDSRVGSSQTTAPGKEIGLSRVYDFALESGSYSTSLPDSNEWDIALYDIQTYTEISLNEPITLSTPAHIKGNSTGAIGYLRYDVTNSGIITAYSTQGKFAVGESFTINGNQNTRVSTAITDFTTKDVKSLYGIDNANVFSADTKLSESYRVSFANITAAVGGISTVSTADFTFIGSVKVGDIVSYTKPGSTIRTFSKVSSVFLNELEIISITSVSGICDGTLPSSNINVSDFAILSAGLQSSSDNTLYTILPKQYVSSVDLTEADLIIRKQFDVNVSSNSTGTITAGENETFLPYDEERYVLILNDGTTEELTPDKFNFTSGSREVEISGLSGSGTGRLIATLRKTKVKNRIKTRNRVKIITIDKSKNQGSGIGGTTLNDGLIYGDYPYGTRVQDSEICLLEPDVTRVYGVFQSNDTNNADTPTIIFTSLDGPTNKTGDLVVGEEFVGESSQSVGIYIEKVNDLKVGYISLNNSKFENGETVRFKESGITAIISSIDVGDSNITSNFSFNDNQKNTIYDYSKIVRKQSSKEPNTRLKIVYEYSSYLDSDDGDITTASSYDQFDFCDIKQYSGIRNTNIIDLRPRVDTYSVEEGSRSPFEFLARSFTSTGNSATNVLASDESFLITYSFYLPRIDRVFLTKDGVFQLTKGESSEYPVPPLGSEDAITISTINLPPYLCNAEDVKIDLTEYKRYQMIDIAKLEDRIENLEYYTSLNLLEVDVASLEIRDTSGISRFKSGFFVDNFTSTINQKKTSTVKNCIDPRNSELRPTHYTTSLDLELSYVNSVGIDRRLESNLISNGVRRTGQLITLDYEEVVEIAQPYSTRSQSVCPYSDTYYHGKIKLYPSSDVWVDQTRVKAKTIEVEGNYTQTAVQSGLDIQTGFGPVTWGSWETVWSGVPEETEIVTNTIDYFTGETLDTSITQTSSGSGGVTKLPATPPRRTFPNSIVIEQDVEVKTYKGTKKRTGTRNILKEQYENKSFGDAVTGTQVLPYMRSRNIEFTGKTFKPYTRLYTFFDGVDMSRYVVPKLLEIQMIRGVFQVGETVVGSLRAANSLIPPIKFRVAQSDHKYGPYNAPVGVFQFNPYTRSVLPETYSATSTILNVDTYSLSNNSQGDYFGFIQATGPGLTGNGNYVLRGQTSGAEAYVTDLRLVTDVVGTIFGSLHITPGSDSASGYGPKFECGIKSFKLTNSPTNSNVSGLVFTSGEENFYAEGKVNSIQENIISVRNARIDKGNTIESEEQSKTEYTIIAERIEGEPVYVPTPPQIPGGRSSSPIPQGVVPVKPPDDDFIQPPQPPPTPVVVINQLGPRMGQPAADRLKEAAKQAGLSKNRIQKIEQGMPNSVARRITQAVQKKGVNVTFKPAGGFSKPGTVTPSGYVVPSSPRGGGGGSMSGGGGSGGGIILIAYGGTYLNTGTVTAAGGAGGTSSPSGYSAVSAGAGGAGSVRTLPISAGA